MPAAIDLTGRRFGLLTVLSRGKKVKWGCWQYAWLCRCDCGAQISVPQRRLPYRESIPASHRIDACDDCRAKSCAVCGGPIPASSSATTCSNECRREAARQYHLSRYHKKMDSDPDFRAKHQARGRDRYQALTPAERLAFNRQHYRDTVAAIGRGELNREARRHHAQRMETAESRERHREKSAAWRAAHLTDIRRTQRDAARRKRALSVARELGELIKQETSDE